MNFYARLLSKYPFTTQCISTGFLFGVGDLIAQKGIERSHEYDFRRTFKLCTFGTLLSGPSMVLWYRILAGRVRFANPTNSAIARVCLDQLLFAPTFLAIFYFYNGIADTEGDNIDWAEIRERMDISYLDTLKTNWMIWPFVQLGNFRLVPLNYQSLLVNTVALGWNSYLSVQNNRSKKSTKKFKSLQPKLD
jgi:protein Mpv17